MSEKLRYRFIAVAALSVFIVLFAFLICINIWNYRNMVDNADRILTTISENRGVFPKTHMDGIKDGHKNDQDKFMGFDFGQSSPEEPFSTRYFSVVLDENGEERSINTNNIVAVSADEAMEMTQFVLGKEKDSGFFSSYRYRITNIEDEVTGNAETLIVFLDCNKDLFFTNNFLLNSVYVGGTGFLAVFVLIVLFSKSAVRPIVESYEKQKTFITNAGHELKTPLAIIDANREVIEMEYGESQWTQSMKNQVERFARLINQLTTLAKMEELQETFVMDSFDFSSVVEDICDEMEAFAQGQEKMIETDISPGVMVKGNEEQLRQLLYILLDNGVKHSKEHSTIEVSLASNGKIVIKNKAYLETSGDMNILMERFYRTDASRSRQTGGYGLGLSIAKAIVDQHKGKISVTALDDETLEIGIMLK